MFADVDSDCSDISAETDIYNLMNNIFVNEKILADDGKFVIMTSHGLFTLHSWKLSTKKTTPFKQFEHSIVALLLTKTYRMVNNDNKIYEDLLDEISFLCNRYLGDLERYPEIYKYFI